MNVVYQIASSVSEIFAAILFVILIKRVKFSGRKITITSINANGNETINSRERANIMADEEITEILATFGIPVKDTMQVEKVASNSGIIYNSNMHDIKNIIGSHTDRRIFVYHKNFGAIKRQVLTTTVTSGMIISHLLSKNIEMI